MAIGFTSEIGMVMTTEFDSGAAAAAHKEFGGGGREAEYRTLQNILVD